MIFKIWLRHTLQCHHNQDMECQYNQDTELQCQWLLQFKEETRFQSGQIQKFTTSTMTAIVSADPLSVLALTIRNARLFKALNAKFQTATKRQLLHVKERSDTALHVTVLSLIQAVEELSAKIT